jgi:molecular chaperone GrpE
MRRQYLQRKSGNLFGMKIGNQNMEAKTADDARVFTGENQAFTDEVEVLKPLEAEIERLREELASERDAHLRLAAEYDNYRRRTKRESARAADEGKRKLLERLVSLADDLDLALANTDGSPGAVAEGLRLIHKRFHLMLEANGVVPFESRGEKFDPERHEAFDVMSGTENEPETVHTEIRRGYFWNDNLLRPALVVVAQ